jgi:phage gp36-like protein
MPATYPVSYTTVAQVMRNVTRIASVTDLTSADVHNFLGKTEAIVNAKLAMRYTLPFTSDIPVLQHITEDIGTYLVLRRLFTDQAVDKSEWFEEFKRAEELLDKIVRGEVALVDASNQVVAPKATVWASTEKYIPTFSELPEEFWIIDPEKMKDELEKRGVGWLWRILL